MMKRRVLCSLVGVLCASTVAIPQEMTWKPELMPREQEVASALAAGPAAIREAAGVYVLTATGFELVRDSSNGFHCLVERSQIEAFEPQCFDAEGSDTLLQQVLLGGELRMRGASEEDLERGVATAWARGSLRAPSRPGINYMLSEKNRVPVGPDQVIPYRPHVMFYVPYLTNADIGGDLRGGSPVFVINEGQPSAYAIVPVPTEQAPE